MVINMPAPLDLLETDRPESLDSVRALLDRARRDGATYFVSPVDWRDEVLYFLLPDRFSDGGKPSRPLLAREDIIAFRRARGATGTESNGRIQVSSGRVARLTAFADASTTSNIAGSPPLGLDPFSSSGYDSTRTTATASRIFST